MHFSHKPLQGMNLSTETHNNQPPGWPLPASHSLCGLLHDESGLICVTSEIKQKWQYVISEARSEKGLPCSSSGKESACNAGDLGSTPGSGRSSREGNGNPLQYSCLENPMDREAWVGYDLWNCKEPDMTGRLRKGITAWPLGWLRKPPCHGDTQAVLQRGSCEKQLEHSTHSQASE